MNKQEKALCPYCKDPIRCKHKIPCKKTSGCTFNENSLLCRLCQQMGVLHHSGTILYERVNQLSRVVDYIIGDAVIQSKTEVNDE